VTRAEGCVVSPTGSGFEGRIFPSIRARSEWGRRFDSLLDYFVLPVSRERFDEPEEGRLIRYTVGLFAEVHFRFSRAFIRGLIGRMFFYRTGRMDDFEFFREVR
jgi:hypothetical protein